MADPVAVHTKDELRTHALDGLADIEEGRMPAQDFLLRITSGTSGAAPVLILTKKESFWNDVSVGRRSGKRGIALMGTRTARLRMLIPLSFAESSDETEMMVLDAADLAPDVLPLINEYAPQIVGGFTSMVVKLVETLAAPPEELGFTGEAYDETYERRIAACAPNAHIREQYASSETGVVAIRECPHLGRNMFHPIPQIRIRIGESEGEDGVGEVMVSLPLTHAVALEDYKTGDLGRWLPRCPCGREAFEVMGRADFDIVRLNGVLLMRVEFDRVAQEMGIRAYEALVHAPKAPHELPRLTLQIPQESWFSTPEILAQEFAARLFVTPTRTLSTLIAEGLWAPLEVVCVDALPVRHKRVALRRV